MQGSYLKTIAKVVLLGSLYVSQFLPVAFFSEALPVFLRQQGISLKAIGLLSAIALPWILKFVWSPLIDRYSLFPRWGHYRSWIICYQSLLALTVGVCAFLDIRHNFTAVLVGMLLLCFFAATQDIATDALAINLLDPHERGLGNGVRNAGNYLGALLGSGGVLLLLNRWGWQTSLLALALCMLLALIPVLAHQEQSFPRSSERKPDLTALINFCRRPGMGRWLLILVLYMTSTGVVSRMFRPLLVDIGLLLKEIACLSGVVGVSAGLVAALIAGFLIRPLSRKRSLIAFGLLQTLAVAACILPAVGITNLPILYLVYIGVMFAQSMAYTAASTIMMDNTQLSTAGTDYTLQAAVLFFGSIGISVASGFIAAALGYAGLFALGTAMGLVSVVVIAKAFDGRNLNTNHPSAYQPTETPK